MNNNEIKNFFKDQTVFITGGSGFLGKVLIEKLLFTCDVRKIYVMVRPKKGKSIQERIDAFFDYPCFDRLKKEKPRFKHLVTFMDGDCEKINMGLNSESEEVLVNETNVVIHAAANVKFDQTLREAANINVRSTREILELGKKMPLLKALVYISTAYSNCPHSHIREEFYDPPMSAKQLMTCLDLNDQVLDRITPNLILPWPNTYTFTKSIAEDLINTEGKHLPLAIVRPAIVMSTIKEPIPGWNDNFNGPIGVAIAASLGVLRCINVKLDYVSPLVPCDYVVNIILVAAWNAAKERQTTTPIYNYVGYRKNFITWRNFMKIFELYAWDYPTEKIVWYYTLRVRENILWHKICVFLQHTVTGYIADFVLICLGRQPIAVKSYERLDKVLSLTSYFGLNCWTFDDANVEQLWRKMEDSDKESFNFNMEYIDWKTFIKSCIVGGRIYLLKDPLETIPQGKKKLRMVTVAHYSLITILYCLLLLVFWWIIKIWY